ncbi:MAG TPA: DUF2339 domain-containing protein [Verrucomicrobiae bacterium]
MKPMHRAELLRLRDDHERLRREVDRYGVRLETFEAQLQMESEPAVEPVMPMEPEPMPVLPPPLPEMPQVREEVLQRVTKQIEEPKYEPKLVPPPPVTPSAAAPAPVEGGNFEMKLATYWFVRLGVVMLLTGLAFFGYYAYQNYIPHLGPAGKLGLIYFAGIGLLFGGHWCQRDRSNDKLTNFGHVLFAGGLATVYFGTYAAHHIEYLRVISSVFVDGILLLAWALVVFWLADRKKSEVMALFAIGLSYYTSGVTQVGMFTLVSNLILTLAAVGFFLRNRWVTLSFIGMVGTYAGYAFWRFYYNGGWVVDHLPQPQIGYGVAFLACYWAAFCAAGFVSRSEALVKTGRATFLSLNNAAFFGLTTLSFWSSHNDRFWLFSLSFGVVLLALSALAARLFKEEEEVGHTLLTQGLLLVTLGIIVKFSGMSLAVLLAAESVVLLVTGYRLNLVILRIGAYITATLSLFHCLPHIAAFNVPDLIKAVGVGGAMLFCGCWTQRQLKQQEDTEADGRLFFWSAATWLLGLVATWQNVDATQRPIIFALLSLLLVHLHPVLRLKELTIMGQLYLVLGQLIWLEAYLSHDVLPGWLLASLIGCTVWMGHWWQHQTRLKVRIGTANVFQGLLALMLIIIGVVWVQSEFALAPRIVWTAALAVGITVYALVTRWTKLAVFAQAFVFLQAGQFALALTMKDIGSVHNLLPIAVLLAFAIGAYLLAGVMGRDDRREARGGLLSLAYIYYTMAALMSLLWVHQYLVPEKWFWVQALLGAAVFAVGMWRQDKALLYVSLLFTVFGLFDFWRPGGTPVIHWPNLLAIALLFMQQQALDRLSEKPEETRGLGTFFITTAGLSLWFYLYRWLSLNAAGFYITAGWAALAFVFLIVGLAVQDRRYRWLGLVILACAIGRAMLIDVWRLATIYRVLSFMALGVVLIVLGYIYTRYQEKIKKWL